ncbi:MAG: PQQ-binding-like beta-propeller repeat protein [Arcicella sp.]|jgi:outer membrane protein assembly factor BamB|nr:PQQ-binding-like beta-propeller repeat protein [Arcicella sp.]
MFPKIRNILFLVLSSIIFLNSCIEQAVRYNNEPENSMVFVASTDKNIYALDAHTGAKLWSIEVNSPIIQGPIVTDSMMYVGCTDQKMYAYNYLKKALRWSVSVGNMVNLTLGNNVIHARNTDKTFRTFNLEDGRKLWETSISAISYDSIPAVGSDVVVIRNRENILTAFNAQNGNVQWSIKTVNLQANPIVSNGLTYFINTFTSSRSIPFVGDFSYKNAYKKVSVVALNNANGSIKWQYSLGKSGLTALNLVDSRNYLYLVDSDKRLLGISKEGGVLKNNYYSGISNVKTLFVANNLIHVQTEKENLYAVDSSLTFKKWAFSEDTRIQDNPNIISGIIFAGTYNRTFYAIDGKTGAKKWAFETGDISPARSTFSNDIVFISSQDGNVHALDAETGTKKWSFKTNGKIYSRPVVLTVDKKIL